MLYYIFWFIYACKIRSGSVNKW